MTCDFVGHPVAAEPQATEAEVAAFRARHAIAPQAPVVLVLPGSRRGEVSRLAPRFGAALAPVLARRPEVRVVVPCVAPLVETVRGLVAGWPGPPPLVLDPRGAPPAEKRAAFGAARAALAASGTVSLELAAAGVPMVIGYDMAPLTRLLLSRMLKVDTVTLVNLVTDSRAVPEFLGKACRPGPMGEALAALLDDGEARARQGAALDLALQRLGRGGEAPGLRAARSVLAALAR